MLTGEDLDELERCVAPVRTAGAMARLDGKIAQFERRAMPYRVLLRSARSLLTSGRMIGPDLEKELRLGARGLWAARRRLGISG